MKDVKRFGIADYVVFALMLALSACTGIYIAVKNHRKKNRTDKLKDYLTGNKTLKTVPVAFSLIASYISGVTIVGTPSEVYTYGANYWLIVFAMCLSGLCVAQVYLPVFVRLQVCSSYEYLELRFSKVIRTMASMFFLLDEIMFLPMLIYVPSLAFNQVSEANVHLIGAIVTVVCVFYVFLGGLKAVVYTDTWQTIIMYVSVIVIVMVGIWDIGGLTEVIDRSYKGQRLQPLNFHVNMYERFTVFSVLIGGFTYWTGFNAVNQTMVQRYLSLPTEKQSKLSVGLFTVGVVFFISFCCFSGLLIYSKYYGCDPLTAGYIKSSDQLLPLYVVETAGHLHGIPGLFIAGIFGAALSSLSVVLNSTAVVLLEDFFRGLCHVALTERLATIISKVIIVSLGVVAVGLVFVVEKIGSGVLEYATTFTAISAGSMFGVFSLGMLIPWANTKGAIAGTIAGFIMSSLVAYGKQIVMAQGVIFNADKLPLSVEKCASHVNKTLVQTSSTMAESDVFPLFRIAYFWITPVGFCSVMVVGIIVSFLTGKTDLRYLDPELISPVAQWVMPEESKSYAGTAIKKIKSQRLLGSDEGLISPVDLNDIRNEGRNEERR